MIRQVEERIEVTIEPRDLDKALELRTAWMGDNHTAKYEHTRECMLGQACQRALGDEFLACANLHIRVKTGYSNAFDPVPTDRDTMRDLVDFYDYNIVQTWNETERVYDPAKVDELRAKLPVTLHLTRRVEEVVR